MRQSNRMLTAKRQIFDLAAYKLQLSLFPSVEQNFTRSPTHQRKPIRLGQPGYYALGQGS
ncbi:MAG: hypothetical protein AAGG44_14355 [Planctomycetota bacterium]